MRKYTLLLMVAGLTVSTSVLAIDTIRYGLEAQYPPFESWNTQGELTGFDIELGQAICRAAHMKCSWTETSFNNLIPALRAKEFDVINSAMDATAQRKLSIDFTDPLYRIPSRLIARSGSGLIADGKALRGKAIGVLQGSIQEVYARKYWVPMGVDVTTYQDQNMVYSDMVLGRIDGTLVMALAGQAGFLDRPEGDGFAFMEGVVSDPAIFGSGIAYGVRKSDTTLKALLNKAIAKVKADGTIKRLEHKYFPGVDLSLK